MTTFTNYTMLVHIVNILLKIKTNMIITVKHNTIVYLLYIFINISILHSTILLHLFVYILFLYQILYKNPHIGSVIKTILTLLFVILKYCNLYKIEIYINICFVFPKLCFL